MRRYINAFEETIVDAADLKSFCKEMKKILEVKKITLSDAGLIIDEYLLKFDQLKVNDKSDLVKRFKKNRRALDNGFGL